MRRILVAVDGSEPSLRAVKYAAELAMKTKAAVTCAYVLAPPMYAAPEALYLPTPELLEAERRLAEEAVAQGRRAAEEAGVQANTVVLEGSPGEALVHLAERSADVDMVVVGSRGRNALSRMLLGSVADRVVHLSKKPVLVVR